MPLLKVPKEPCYTDECLVQAACRLKDEWPWKRIHECEMYQKHRDKEYRIMSINGFFTRLYEIFLVIVGIFIIVIIPLSFVGLGIWKFWELTKPFILGLIT